MTAPKSGSGSFFYNNLDVHRSIGDADRDDAIRIISRMIEACQECPTPCDSCPVIASAREMGMMMFADLAPTRQGSRG